MTEQPGRAADRGRPPGPIGPSIRQGIEEQRQKGRGRLRVLETIGEFIESLDECVEILRKESDDGNLYSGLQADVIVPISTKLKEIVEDKLT